MNIEEFEKIFIENGENTEWEGDNFVQGVIIISKYINIHKNTIVIAAEHDIVYGPEIQILIDNNITEEDIKKLAIINWSLEDDRLYCFI